MIQMYVSGRLPRYHGDHTAIQVVFRSCFKMANNYKRISKLIAKDQGRHCSGDWLFLYRHRLIFFPTKCQTAEKEKNMHGKKAQLIFGVYVTRSKFINLLSFIGALELCKTEVYCQV